MPLALPDVTIVCIDNVAQELARMALGDTLRHIDPAEVWFWSDTRAGPIGADLLLEKWAPMPFHERGKEAPDQVLWYQVAFVIETSHFLTVQWDGWATNAEAWTDEFLAYDYIGAPWWWHPPGSQVGNGGFSLRSRRLMQFLAEHRVEFPYRYPEDDAIGRHYRPRLEAAGFRFAPPEVAMRFSFEHPPADPRVKRAKSFGFHDIRNWGLGIGRCRDRPKARRGQRLCRQENPADRAHAEKPRCHPHSGNRTMITPDTFYTVLSYPLRRYPFPDMIAHLLDEADLAALRDDTLPPHSRENDQKTRWHERFYATREAWGPLYRQFVTEFVARQFREPFYFQAIPTFRVHLPDSVAVGEWHSDGDYGHSAGELNFWLPLTGAFQTNSIYIEDQSWPRPICAYPGDVIVFDAVAREHGNHINQEGRSRVSFDFRCLLVRLYRESDARSVNMGCRFAPGDYYAAEPVGTDSGPCTITPSSSTGS
jgi:hypothetical protein